MSDETVDITRGSVNTGDTTDGLMTTVDAATQTDGRGEFIICTTICFNLFDNLYRFYY